jgi:hypothetical protein
VTIEAVLVFAILISLWTKDVFTPQKPPKITEQQVQDAIATYFSKGITIRLETDRDKPKC